MAVQSLGNKGLVAFTVKAPHASRVSLAGDFNGWDVKKHPMTQDSQGIWRVQLPMLESSEVTDTRYGYKFVIDGDTWVADPENADRSGEDSVFLVPPRRRHLPKRRGRVWMEGTYYSTVLGQHRHYLAYFPHGYREAPHKQFPVLYLLHGYQDRGAQEWLVKGNLHHILDVLIDLGKIPPMLVIVPECGNHFYAERKDGGGNHEQAFVGDLVVHVDQTFRTKASRRGRAIGGVSAGGFGAIKLALQYPHLFCSAHSHMGLFDISDPSFFPEIFGYGDSSAGHRRWNSPLDLLDETYRADKLQIGFDCGEQDALFSQNQLFQDKLVRGSVPHAFWSAPGYHTWDLVQRMLPLALQRHGRAFSGHVPIRGQVRVPS